MLTKKTAIPVYARRATLDYLANKGCILSEAHDIEEETEIIEFHIPENKEETVVKDNKVEMFETRKPRRFGNVAAIALVALAAGITAFNTIGKGGI